MMRRPSLATFIGCVLVFIATCFSGCFASGAVSEAAYQQALDLVDRGASLLKQRRLREADAVFSLAYEIAPLSQALDGRGCVALVAGDLQRAEEYLTRAYNDDRTYDHALGNLALVYELQGHHEAAKALYETFLAKQPDSSAVRHNLAALELDYRRRSGTASPVDERVARDEFLKAAALSQHGVIADNITRVGGID